MHLILTFFAQILTAPVGRVWRLTHFYSNRSASTRLYKISRSGFFMCVISIFFGFTHKIKSMELFSAPCFFVALIFY